MSIKLGTPIHVLSMNWFMQKLICNRNRRMHSWSQAADPAGVEGCFGTLFFSNERSGRNQLQAIDNVSS
jgi:hypothetical protein